MNLCAHTARFWPWPSPRRCARCRPKNSSLARLLMSFRPGGIVAGDGPAHSLWVWTRSVSALNVSERGNRVTRPIGPSSASCISATRVSCCPLSSRILRPRSGPRSGCFDLPSRCRTGTPGHSSPPSWVYLQPSRYDTDLGRHAELTHPLGECAAALASSCVGSWHDSRVPSRPLRNPNPARAERRFRTP